MNFRRVLLIGELETDPSAGLAALRRVAPEAEELHVVAHAPGPGFGWVAGDSAEAAPLVERLRRATTGAAPSVYESSPGVRRHFCATCGTPMAYDADWDGANIHLYAAALDDHSGLVPQIHYHHDEKVGWVTLGDTLPHKPG